MTTKQVDCANLSPARRWAVLACLLLVGLNLAVQAFHLHSNELASADFKHCAICQVAQAPAQAVPAAHVVFGLSAVAFLVVSTDSRVKPVLDSFSLFSRPPPLV